MSMRRRLDPEARQEEILRAAIRAFESQPYEQVQLEDIARDAGASRALINHYFGGKRGLFVAVVREMVARAAGGIRANRELGELTTEQMVATNTSAMLDLIEADRAAVLTFFRGGPAGGDPELAALHDELRDRTVERILANHLGDGPIPPAAHHAMRAGIGLIERALLDWAEERGPEPRGDSGDHRQRHPRRCRAGGPGGRGGRAQLKPLGGR